VVGGLGIRCKCVPIEGTNNRGSAATTINGVGSTVVGCDWRQRCIRMTVSVVRGGGTRNLCAYGLSRSESYDCNAHLNVMSSAIIFFIGGHEHGPLGTALSGKMLGVVTGGHSAINNGSASPSGLDLGSKG
jgi:hypothetical protein